MKTILLSIRLHHCKCVYLCINLLDVICLKALLYASLFTRVSRKEFSNDPTAEMAQTSSVFEGSVGVIQRGITALTQYEANDSEVSHQTLLINQY